jgi:hypothetical protein
VGFKNLLFIFLAFQWDGPLGDEAGAEKAKKLKKYSSRTKI